MRVVRLEIFGFKSFMDRLVLPLDSGVTGVVGPNGCGKSNIVDALRWVLGETNAKNLRGGVLEDVIFNGTDALRPLGLAEVSFTLRASGDNFFEDLVSSDLEAELVVEDAAREVQSLEESTESDLGDQGRPSTSDPQESAQEQPGRPHLTVVSGPSSTAASPPDSSEMYVPNEEREEIPDQAEEASVSQGVSEAALAKRFAWLRASSEVQVTRRLYRSGESEFFINRVPCRLKDMKELFRAVGISARAYTIVAQGEVARIVTARPEDRRLILEEAAGVVGFRDRIAASNRRLKDTEINISRLDDIIKEVSRAVGTLRRQASKAKNRHELKTCMRNIEVSLFEDEWLRIAADGERVQQQAQEAQAREQDSVQRLDTARADEEAARGALMQIDVEGDEMRSKIDAIREELNSRARQRSTRTSRIAELNAYGLSRETEIRRLQERKSTLEDRSREAIEQGRALKGREEALGAELTTLSHNDESQLRLASEHLTTAREDLKKSDQALREVREKLARSQGQLEIGEKQLGAASPIEKLRESVGSDRLQVFGDDAERTRIVVGGLRVPSEYVSAVEAVLSHYSAFLVSEDPFAVARKFSDLEEIAEDDEKLSLGVLSQQIPQGVVHSSSDGLAPHFQPLIELVSPESWCHELAGYLLRDVYLAPDLESALTFFESGNGSREGAGRGITCVTPAGQIITATSFCHLRGEGGLVQLKQRVDELRTSCAELEARGHSLRAERDRLSQVVSDAEAHHAQALRESQERQRRARELSNELGTIRGRLQAEQRVAAQVDQDLQRVAQQMVDAERQKQEHEDERQQIEQQLAALADEDESALHSELRVLQQEYLTVDEQRKAGRADLSRVAQVVEGLRRELDGVRAEISNTQLAVQKAQLEQQHLQERISEELSEEFYHQMIGRLSQSGKRLDPAARVQLKDELSKLRARIEREGDVDPTSIERFEEESQRLQHLEEQHKDLSGAARTLRHTIERLEATSVAKFLSTFELVRENFSRLVPRLFGGGKGELELTDPSNPLESGVSIIARPPGKKLKSIDLLSGGEKALCATALIFSMFLVRPSPLCVLDEVDAPLDEANLVRFLSIVKEWSSKTQFIMITHNKTSMAAADRLVGVTMEQPGASKVITVSLQDAYSQVA